MSEKNLTGVDLLNVYDELETLKEKSMGEYNMPPGVATSMIPGNSPDEEIPDPTYAICYWWGDPAKPMRSTLMGNFPTATAAKAEMDKEQKWYPHHKFWIEERQRLTNKMLGLQLLDEQTHSEVEAAAEVWDGEGRDAHAQADDIEEREQRRAEEDL